MLQSYRLTPRGWDRIARIDVLGPLGLDEEILVALAEAEPRSLTPSQFRQRQEYDPSWREEVDKRFWRLEHSGDIAKVGE